MGTQGIEGSTVFVTGANGGLGREWVRQCLDRGAVKIYAADLAPQEWGDARVVPVILDVTDTSAIESAADAAGDVTILINNAGIPLRDPILSVAGEALRQAFEVNFFGPIAVAQQFVPIIVSNGGGAVINVISLLSWLSIAPGYSAAKSAFWSATNAMRLELASAGVDVVALHMGYTATPMTQALQVPKNDPADVVRSGLDGLESGALEVLADQWSSDVKAALAGPVEVMYPQLAGATLPFGQPSP